MNTREYVPATLAELWDIKLKRDARRLRWQIAGVAVWMAFGLAVTLLVVLA